jgi:ketosteroid isomerase-like protein
MLKRTIWTLAFAACLIHSPAFAFNDDAFTALIGERIEAFSDASAKGDQARMDGLLDDEVLFSSGSGTIDRDQKLDKSDAVAALLRQQVEAFQAAGQHPDTAAIRRYVADKALFISEEGAVSEQPVFRRTASALAFTDWIVHYSDDVAVLSFIGGPPSGIQTPPQKFLAVETWIKSDTGWKLAASQAIPLYQDAPAATLSPDTLKDYAGLYTGGPGLAITISLDGSTLAASTNGGKAVAYQAEGHDIFFTPGLPPGVPRSRILFERDKDGHITGYISSRGLKVTRSQAVASQSSAAPTQSGVSSTVLPAADLVVRRFGNMAVATFIHERVTNYYGQVLHAKYRSTETWIKRGAEWKMLALQSCELNRPLPS